MPYLSITANVPVSREAESAIAAAVSKTIATGFGKPEAYVMVSVHSQMTMLFAGTNEPAAFVDIRSIGLPGNLNKVSQSLTLIVAEQAKIPARRIFISFTDVAPAHWAHGGSTFA